MHTRGVSRSVRLIGVFLCALLWSLAPNEAIGAGLFADNDGAYTGGQGVITFEGPRGMFLNPTSGTLAQGSLTLQSCMVGLQNNFQNVVANGFLTAVGLTDWLELGAVGTVINVSTKGDYQTIGDVGPYARVRLFKDEGLMPEVSVGGFLREGNEVRVRRTAFIAASKRVDLNNPIVKGVRLHAGFRQFWQPTSTKVTISNSSVGYVGGELELPKYVYLIVETSNKERGQIYTPFAFGFQVRHPSGFAFTLSGLQTGDQSRIAPYVGIGINFG